jgi:hypothetical protein
MKCTVTPKPADGTAKATPPLKAGAGVSDFNLQDNGDNTFTVLGVDKAGNTTDISAVAKLAAVSDNPAVITVDPPQGMTVGIHAPVNPAPEVGAKANVTLTATWTDGSVGPFAITLPGTITGGPATGLAVEIGTPTVH